MSTDVSLWMPAIYVYVACCQLYYFYMSLIYRKYLPNVHFRDIPHTFIPDFTLHSTEKNPHKFSANYALITFRIPHSAKTPSVRGEPQFFPLVAVRATYQYLTQYGYPNPN